MSNFRERLGSSDVKNAFHQMCIPGWLKVFFALPAVLASEFGYTENDEAKTGPWFILFLQRYQWFF